jgi:hypothetical protein
VFINISTDEDKERSLAKVANSDNITDLLNAEDFKGPQGPKGEGAQVSIKGRFDDATKMATE